MKNNKKGFTLVELMVVVAIIAILAAVALPMYSTFKQKAKVGNVLKALSGAQASFQTHFDDNQAFTGIAVPADGGSIRFTNLDGDVIRVGSGLSGVDQVTYTGAIGTGVTVDDQYTISWAFSASGKCPADFCDGSWRLWCSQSNDKCTVVAVIGTANQLGLEFGDLADDPNTVS